MRYKYSYARACMYPTLKAWYTHNYTIKYQILDNYLTYTNSRRLRKRERESENMYNNLWYTIPYSILYMTRIYTSHTICMSSSERAQVIAYNKNESRRSRHIYPITTQKHHDISIQGVLLLQRSYIKQLWNWGNKFSRYQIL